MENKHFCQSCSMPIDNIEMRGTEKNGSKSEEYCKYCYTNGAFVNPNMTMEEMKTIVRTQLAQRNGSAGMIQNALNVLPELKRWKSKTSATL